MGMKIPALVDVFIPIAVVTVKSTAAAAATGSIRSDNTNVRASGLENTYGPFLFCFLLYLFSVFQVFHLLWFFCFLVFSPAFPG